MKSGFVSILGRPNAGKSTLLNQLIGAKIAIVANKPQTTRTSIQGVLTLPEAQIVFLDTPGIHKAESLISTALAPYSVRIRTSMTPIRSIVAFSNNCRGRIGNVVFCAYIWGKVQSTPIEAKFNLDFGNLSDDRIRLQCLG